MSAQTLSTDTQSLQHPWPPRLRCSIAITRMIHQELQQQLCLLIERHVENCAKMATDVQQSGPVPHHTLAHQIRLRSPDRPTLAHYVGLCFSESRAAQSIVVQHSLVALMPPLEAVLFLARMVQTPLLYPDPAQNFPCPNDKPPRRARRSKYPPTPVRSTWRGGVWAPASLNV